MHGPSPDVLLSQRDIVREKETVREGFWLDRKLRQNPFPARSTPWIPSLASLSLWRLSLVSLSASLCLSLSTLGPSVSFLAGCVGFARPSSHPPAVPGLASPVFPR